MALLPHLADGPGQDKFQDFYNKYDESVDALNAITAGNTLAFKVLTMGGWDMQANASKDFAHGLSDISKITSVNIVIIRDDLVYVRDLNGTVFLGADQEKCQGAWRADSTNISINHFGGQFDSTNYNDSGINRGYITIAYLK